MTFCLRVVRASWKNVRQVVIKTTPSDILRNVPFTQVINNHYKKKRPRRTLREFQKGSMNTCVYKPAKMCVYIYRYVLCVCFIRMQVYVLGHIHTYMSTYTHTWIRTHTHTHTHTHTVRHLNPVLIASTYKHIHSTLRHLNLVFAHIHIYKRIHARTSALSSLPVSGSLRAMRQEATCFVRPFTTFVVKTN